MVDNGILLLFGSLVLFQTPPTRQWNKRSDNKEETQVRRGGICNPLMFPSPLFASSLTFFQWSTWKILLSQILLKFEKGATASSSLPLGFVLHLKKGAPPTPSGGLDFSPLLTFSLTPFTIGRQLISFSPLFSFIPALFMALFSHSVRISYYDEEGGRHH